MRKLNGLVVVLSLLAFTAGSSEVYKWVDEDGVIHYTDMPPQDQRYNELEVPDKYTRSEKAPDDSAYREAIEQQEARRKQRAEQREQDALERQAEAEQKTTSEANCSRAIHYLNTLKRQCPVFFDGTGILRGQCPGYYSSYEGERTYIDDKERQELIEYYRGLADQCTESQR